MIMDFRTEWSSWVLFFLMMIIAYVINPWSTDGNALMFISQVVGLPLATIAIASIPVLIVCYFLKVIPDIDYSIRLAFLYMLFLLIKHLMA